MSKERYHELGEEWCERLLKWWRDLADHKGARAQLRRCASPAEAVLHPETHRLLSVISWASPEAVATIAGTLAHIESGEKDRSSLGKKLASTEKNGRALFSETRFRQLLSCRTWDEFYRALRRAMQILDREINPLIVADTILWWDKESIGATRVRPGKSLPFRLAKDYYGEFVESKTK